MQKKDDPEFKKKRSLQRIRFMVKWKEAALDLLGGKCVRCYFSDKRALQFDHINGDGYLTNKSRNAAHYKHIFKSVTNKENRFQILCANCNWIKRFENNEDVNGFKKRKSFKDDYAKCAASKEAPSLFI